MVIKYRTDNYPYKVYTALLTQSSDDNPDSTYSGDLMIGRTYQIFDLGGAAGYDFTNVGAPNNNIDTWFVATGKTPNSWGTNVCLNYNSGAPVVTVLENTIGNVWFTYAETGTYRINIPQFKILKTYYSRGGMGDATQVDLASKIEVLSNSDFKCLQVNTFNNTPSLSNNILNNTPIEIRVYN
jgi:hypothetical protein